MSSRRLCRFRDYRPEMHLPVPIECEDRSSNEKRNSTTYLFDDQSTDAVTQEDYRAVPLLSSCVSQGLRRSGSGAHTSPPVRAGRRLSNRILAIP